MSLLLSLSGGMWGRGGRSARGVEGHAAGLKPALEMRTDEVKNGVRTGRVRIGARLCGHPVSVLDQFQDTWRSIIFLHSSLSGPA